MSRSITLSLAGLVACASGAEPTPTPAVEKQVEAKSGDLAAELWSRPLAVGVNRLEWKLTDAGQAVTAAKLTQRPRMSMVSVGKSHGAPKVDPVGGPNADGRFEGIVIFTMPSMGQDTWSVGLDVERDGAAAVPLAFPTLMVADRDVRRTLTVGTSSTAESWIVTLDLPDPVVGVNDYHLTVHAARHDHFPPVTGLSIRGTPDMPSMGHGSSGNVDPAHVGDGFYAGQLNLTMSGDWRVVFEVSQGESKIGQVEYELSL